MAEEAGQQQEVVVPSPEDVLEKLKFLHYEKDFCQAKGKKPIHKMYFGIAHSNLNEQFFYFTSLCAWLFNLLNIKFPTPDQFEDPNVLAANILDGLRKAGLPADFAPAKLKAGHGEIVCAILSLLLDQVLENRRFAIQRPVYPQEEADDEIIEDENDDSGEIQDTAVVYEAEEDEMLFIAGQQTAKGEKDEPVMQAPLEPQTDPAEWQLELERVAPLLKIRTDTDSKEWRNHLETTRELHTGIVQNMPDSKAQLEKIATTIGQAIDGIVSREKYINSQYDNLVDEYRRTKESLVDVSREHQHRADMVANKTNELNQISEELDSIKSEVDDMGKNITETGPLVKIKDSMKKLKKEMREMDLRIATVSHSLLAIEVKNRAGIFERDDPDPFHSVIDDDYDDEL